MSPQNEKKEAKSVSLRLLLTHTPPPTHGFLWSHSKKIFWLPYALTFKLSTEMQSAWCHMSAVTTAKNIQFLNSSWLYTKTWKLRTTCQWGILLENPYAWIKLSSFFLLPELKIWSNHEKYTWTIFRIICFKNNYFELRDTFYFTLSVAGKVECMILYICKRE